jgi:HK97 family phage major capsid protein
MTVEEILAALQAIIDGAVADDGAARDLTEEEAQRYEQLEKQLATARKSVEIRARQQAYTTPVNSGLVSAAPKPDNTLDRAFEHYLRTGKENADLVQLRAQSEGTGSEGGYVVPDGFRDKIVDRMVQFGGLANAVETVTTSTGNNLPWVTLDDTANTGEIVAEGGTFSSGADLVFGTANLGAYSYAAGGASSLPLRVSWELLQDAAVDVEGLVSKKLGERIARIQSTHWVSGTGVQQPLGIVYGLTGTEVSSALSYADLVDAIHRVDPAYRDGAKWAFNDLSLAAIRKLLDGDNRPLLQPAGNGIAGSPGGETLLGYPVVIDQAFDDLTLTSGAGINWGVFGQLSEAYVIRRVKDITLVVNPWSRAANRQTEFSAWARADGTRQNTNAYTVLAGYTA